MSWARFLLAMLPAATEVLRDLHQLTGGNVALSKAAIRRIRDDGYRLEEAEAKIDERLERLRKEQP